MASPWFIPVKRASASRLVLIVPAWGQKVKSISLGSFKVLIRSREEEPAGSTNRALIAYCLGHDLDANLQKLQTKLVIPDINHLILGLVTYCHRHNVQTAGYYLTITISPIPTNSLFA